MSPTEISIAISKIYKCLFLPSMPQMIFLNIRQRCIATWSQSSPYLDFSSFSDIMVEIQAFSGLYQSLNLLISR